MVKFRNRRFFVLAVFKLTFMLVLGIVCCPGAALAADYYVNDDVAENGIAAGDNSNDGMSPDTPMRNIQALLDRYPDIGTDCTLHVSAGTYGPVAIGDTHSGLTLEGAGADVTTILGRPARSCIYLDNVDDCTISRFTLKGGAATYGGGIFCDSSSVVIANNIIEKNVADVGGAMYCLSSEVEVTNCVVQENVATTGSGGGICCWSTTATITSNVIFGNRTFKGGTPSACEGGGIYLNSPPSDVLIASNVIAANGARGSGGGVAARLASQSVIIENNVVVGNWSWGDGGGLWLRDGTASVVNNTFSLNLADRGGGLACSVGCTADVLDCIFYQDDAFGGPELWVENSDVSIDYCDIQGGFGELLIDGSGFLYWGSDNVDEDPLFARPGRWDWLDEEAEWFWVEGDYHLMSRGGRWDPAGGGGGGGGCWVLDDVHSPCIDTGDPLSDYALEPTPNGGRVNMGAYGNTAEASLAYSASSTIEVNTEPDSGTWTITGPAAYDHDGAGDESVPGLFPGSYTVTWHALEGYDLPPGSPETQDVIAGQTTAFNGSYTPAVDALRLRVTGIVWSGDCSAATISYEANNTVQRYYYRMYQTQPGYISTGATLAAFGDLDAGYYLFVVTAKDESGDFAPEPCRVWFYNKPVGAEYQVSLQSYVVDNDAVTFSLQANGSTRSHYVKLYGVDAGYVADADGVATYSGLADGMHYFVATGKEAGTGDFPPGGPARQFFYIDTAGF